MSAGLQSMSWTSKNAIKPYLSDATHITSGRPSPPTSPVHSPRLFISLSQYLNGKLHSNLTSWKPPSPAILHESLNPQHHIVDEKDKM